MAEDLILITITMMPDDEDDYEYTHFDDEEFPEDDCDYDHPATIGCGLGR